MHGNPEACFVLELVELFWKHTVKIFVALSIEFIAKSCACTPNLEVTLIFMKLESMLSAYDATLKDVNLEVCLSRKPRNYAKRIQQVLNTNSFAASREKLTHLEVNSGEKKSNFGRWPSKVQPLFAIVSVEPLNVLIRYCSTLSRWHVW